MHGRPSPKRRRLDQPPNIAVANAATRFMLPSSVQRSWQHANLSTPCESSVSQPAEQAHASLSHHVHSKLSPSSQTPLAVSGTQASPALSSHRHSPRQNQPILVAQTAALPSPAPSEEGAFDLPSSRANYSVMDPARHNQSHNPGPQPAEPSVPPPRNVDLSGSPPVQADDVFSASTCVPRINAFTRKTGSGLNAVGRGRLQLLSGASSNADVFYIMTVSAERVPSSPYVLMIVGSVVSYADS